MPGDAEVIARLTADNERLTRERKVRDALLTEARGWVAHYDQTDDLLARIDAALSPSPTTTTPTTQTRDPLCDYRAIQGWHCAKVAGHEGHHTCLPDDAASSPTTRAEALDPALCRQIVAVDPRADGHYEKRQCRNAPRSDGYCYLHPLSHQAPAPAPSTPIDGAATWEEPFCACGRKLSECDKSRRGCVPAAPSSIEAATEPGRCVVAKPDGARCKAPALVDTTRCYFHSDRKPPAEPTPKEGE